MGAVPRFARKPAPEKFISIDVRQCAAAASLRRLQPPRGLVVLSGPPKRRVKEAVLDEAEACLRKTAIVVLLYSEARNLKVAKGEKANAGGLA
jgi:hypothetical protein